MADLEWLVRRLKAMSIPEIGWRISQKVLQKREEKRFRPRKQAVTDALFHKKISGLQLDPKKMHLNLRNKEYSLRTQIPLPGGYDYETYKKQWNAGFQTGHTWPEAFSYFLEYKQRDDIGDARTNWELNRHFQFVLLAKNYAATGQKKYLEAFQDLFEDWNQKSPFLWGISWTSVMEVAIRCSNWCYAYCFLANTDVSAGLLKKLQNGILNMTDYISGHYSRYSSANNHLIVEAYAIGQTGILCGYRPWIDLSLKILTRELAIQNYPDGVNKELSLHYQAFYMEAMGLMLRLLRKNHMEVPETWLPMLQKMCDYVATCMGDHGETVVFGDDDEGKILDLQGDLQYYLYVMGLFGCLLEERYTDDIGCQENLNWLFTREEIRQAQRKTRFQPLQSACFREGGNTILRSRDRRILMGIDHAALGFGSIAAHGHADALSFQLFADGHPVLADPGTYIYHCDLESRNAFRKTENHNTVCISGKDQSEMLGAFLWGRKAKCELLEFQENAGGVTVRASHDGYRPEIHTREYWFDQANELIIKDSFNKKSRKKVVFVLSDGMQAEIMENRASVHGMGLKIEMRFCCGDAFTLKKAKKQYSARYGVKTETDGIEVCFEGYEMVSQIFIRYEDGQNKKED